jgi:hypothetical protein
MESNQSIAIENPSDAQLQNEPIKSASDAAVSYELMGSSNPDGSMASVVPVTSVQNPVNGNSDELAGYQSTQVSANGALQNGVSGMALEQEEQLYLAGILI